MPEVGRLVQFSFKDQFRFSVRSFVAVVGA
jgi:hypothetical protein